MCQVSGLGLRVKGLGFLGMGDWVDVPGVRFRVNGLVLGFRV